jgi:hypothetical protein
MAAEQPTIKNPPTANLSDVMRAAVRRVWLQGRPVYERIDGKTYEWWPDGRMTPKDGGGPELFADTQTVFSH